eukprot:scaffold25914_cov148-Skeletonema_dohrnii-CCMP3373.AAC.1
MSNIVGAAIKMLISCFMVIDQAKGRAYSTDLEATPSSDSGCVKDIVFIFTICRATAAEFLGWLPLLAGFFTSAGGTISDANLVARPVNRLASASFAFGTGGYLDHAHVLGGILSQDIEKVKDIVFICVLES